VRAELILFVVALSLSALAFAFAVPRRTFRWRIPIAVACCALAGLAPLLMYVALDPERARGQALWEWSAVGGPAIQASYRLDGLAVIGVAVGALYIAGALVATTRVPARHQLLRPVILLNGLVFVTLAVTDDLIADIVVLGALAATTSFMAVLVSPAAAVARITGYLAGGVQGFVVAALLLSRFGGASFRFDTISPDAATPGVILAASLGAALWIALATGSPIALAGAFVVLAGGGLAAVTDAFWMPPHRSYITAMASSTVIVSGALAIAIGAFDAPDLLTAALAVVAAGAVVGLELAHAGRRLSIAAVPADLDVSASIASFLGTVLVVLALALPLLDAMSDAMGRPNTRSLDELVTLIPVVAVVATLLVVAARAVRVLLPELTALSTRLEVVVSAADPVPIASASFRALAGSATTVSGVFAAFEERAGVWLALTLIATLLVWALR
jgi:hypothetical protein